MAYKREDLEMKTREELEEMAKEKGVGDTSEMDKEELIDALMNEDENDGQGMDGDKENMDDEDDQSESDNPDDWKNEPGNQS